MHIEFFLEEESAEEALEGYPAQDSFRQLRWVSTVHVLSGQTATYLENCLMLLKVYRQWITADDWRIMVLVDRDQEECFQLKATVRRK